MKNLFVVSVLLFVVACRPDAPTPNAAPKAQVSTSTLTTKTDTSASTATVASGVTRHLPGTLITTATGKYYYLVMGDGTASAFATTALVTASGYNTNQALVVSADELWCYSRGDQIATALPAPASGTLLDGSLVKEDGKSAVYVVSESVAWPVMNQAAFDLAGYNLANVVVISAGSLVKKVAAVGDCTLGVACLDATYEHTCAKDEMVGDIPITSVDTNTQTQTTTSSATASATGTQTQTPINVTQIAGANVVRHLPGTVITTGTGKYYLVNDDETVSPFASATLVTASGYTSSMVIKVSANELSCYGLGAQITVALPAPPSGYFRDGALVNEQGRSDTYVVSGGIAWPIINETTFKMAGYTFDATAIIPAGTLSGRVEAIGNCVQGVFCLDIAYQLVCAVGNDPDTNVTVDTNTAVATATASASATKTQATTATKTQTQTQTQTQTTGSTTVVDTDTETATATTVTTVSTATATVTASATATRTSSATVTATNTTTATATGSSTVTASGTSTVTASSTATTVSTVSSGTVGLSWVYAGNGSKLCLNAAYFSGGNQAVLLVWLGPGADATRGQVVTQTGDRFCWDFQNREKGLYYFWADVPDGSCNADLCPRDAVPGNGAQYMTAPKATAAARDWLACQNSGCDGAAYWDGTAFTPMGG